MKNKKSSGKSLFLLLPLLIFTVAGILLYKFGERWLRSVLIYLSHAAWARKIIENLQISRSVARRFVAGETIDEAMSATSLLNAQGMAVTLDFLGESVTDRTVAISARDEILRLLDRIEEQGLEANVSVKLSQLGLRIEKELALANMRQILARATQYGNKVRIDMEESELVDITLDIYHQLLDKYEFQNVGIVIQSYLYRSEADVAQLIEEGAWVRLCKGAYAEPPDVAFADKRDTDASYVQLANMMLSETARANGVHLGLATHDENIIKATKAYASINQINPEQYEFQMLFGIRRNLQEQLIRDGYKLRIYVPYGTAWYRYFVRRHAERPANLWFFIRNFFKQ